MASAAGRHRDLVHNILRWATLWLVLVALGASLIEAHESWFALDVAAAILGARVAALVGQIIAGRGRVPARPLAHARSFAIVNGAFARAWLDVLRGRRIAAWAGVEWESTNHS